MFYSFYSPEALINPRSLFPRQYELWYIVKMLNFEIWILHNMWSTPASGWELYLLRLFEINTKRWQSNIHCVGNILHAEHVHIPDVTKHCKNDGAIVHICSFWQLGDGINFWSNSWWEKQFECYIFDYSFDWLIDYYFRLTLYLVSFHLHTTFTHRIQQSTILSYL